MKMKRVIGFTLTLAVMMSMCGCLTTTVPTPTPQRLPTNWMLDYMIDDFGDETDACMQSVSLGSFSNLETTDSELATVMFFVPGTSNDVKISYFVFRLFENDEHQVKFKPEDECIIKIKVDDEIFDSTLDVDENSGDLLLIQQPNNSSIVYKMIFNSMLLGKNVRCIIEFGTSKYSFTIASDGFVDSANAMMKTYGYDPFDIREYPVE